MRRLSLFAVAVAFFVVACTDRVPTGVDAPGNLKVTTASECVVLSRSQIEALFTAAINEQTGGPDRNSVLGGQINAVFSATNPADAQAKAISAVDFILKQYRDNHPHRLQDAAKLGEFINALMCYVGLGLQVGDEPGDIFIHEPSAEDKTYKNKDQTAGLIIPGGSTTELQIIAIVPGNVANINTVLDKYPLVFRITRTSTTPYTSPVIVSICPAADVSSEVYENLLLGHQHGSVFKLLHKPGQGVDLPCAVEESGGSPLPSATGVRADIVSQSSHLATRGPVNGSTATYSDFAPIDRRTGANGSGATYAPPDWGVLLDGPSTSSCPTSYPAGSDVEIGCRPGITLRTPNGEVIANAMFDWNITAPSNGSPGIAQGTPAGCTGSFLTTHGFRTNQDGETYVCWRLSTTVGTNTVHTTPRRDPDDLTDPLSDPLVVIGEFDENNNFIAKNEWTWSLQGTAETPVFQFSGFLPPIRPLPTVNSVKAGNAVPVKFTLGGFFGLTIFTPAAGNFPGYPQSVQVSCPNGAAVLSTEEQTSTAGGSTIGFNFLTDQYTYTWKTEKSWSGTCRELRVSFVHDGDPPQAGYYTALFHFTK